MDVIAYSLLVEWVKENRITVTHLTPAMGQILVGGADGQIASLRNAFFVGDILTKKDTARLRNLAPNAVVVNLFGSTESARAVSFFEVPSKASDPHFLEDMPDIIPCGQDMRNVQLPVVDRNDTSRLFEVGEQGELFIRAGGLAEGYLEDDERTVELNRTKFVTNWFVDTSLWAQQYEKSIASGGQKPWMKHYKGPRDRLYKSGDLGRYRADGSVECTGRIDSQAKSVGSESSLEKSMQTYSSTLLFATVLHWSEEIRMRSIHSLRILSPRRSAGLSICSSTTADTWSRMHLMKLRVR